MGSATREALASSKEALAALGAGADLATADGLFAAGRAIGGSSHLSAALSDPAADASAKREALPVDTASSASYLPSSLARKVRWPQFSALCPEKLST